MWQIYFTKKYYIFILRRWEYKFVFNHILVFSFIKLLVGIFKVSYGATKHMIEDMPTWWKICRQLAKVEEDHECVICQREKATRTWNLWKLKPAESQSLLRYGHCCCTVIGGIASQIREFSGIIFFKTLQNIQSELANMWCLGCSCEESLYHCNLYRIN